MKIRKLSALLLSIPLLLLSSCDDGTFVECLKRWVLYNNQGATISFTNGEMIISSNSLSSAVPPTTILYQDTIQGDFEVIVEYEGLFYNSPGLGFLVALTGNALNQGNNYFSAQIGTTLYPGLPQGTLHVGAFIDSSGNSPSQFNGQAIPATNTNGELRFRRVGSLVEVISKTGTSNIATYTQTFYSSPIIFGILYGSNYPNTPQYTSSIRFTGFRYYQGTTLIDSDGFDCNSLN